MNLVLDYCYYKPGGKYETHGHQKIKTVEEGEACIQAFKDNGMIVRFWMIFDRDDYSIKEESLSNG